MKKTRLSFLLLLVFTGTQAQLLSMPEVIQEQDQWCWAGVSKSVLDYYGIHKQQCEIAEYAREVITWSSFGTTDCCVNASQGCNWWNYNWGAAGSIQDILIHFGNVQNSGVSAALTLTQAAAQVNLGRPFIVRWGWTTGGGHFVIGHGVSGSNVYYMNPWFGEGLHVSTYSWLVNDGSHTWTHTNKINTNPLAASSFETPGSIAVYPNPTSGTFTVNAATALDKIVVTDVLGKEVMQVIPNSVSAALDMSNYQSGIYFIRSFSEGRQTVKKLVLK